MNRLVLGQGTKAVLLDDVAEPHVRLRPESRPVIDVRPADQTVTVDAGIGIDELQDELRRHGQALPIPSEEFGPLLRGVPGTVGGLIGMNLPHGLYAQCGGIKDWLLHTETIFRGEKAKSGAKVVKSVAGYDAHKLYVGARGTLGPVVTATLRTWPLRALPEVSAAQVRAWDGGPFWVVRTLRGLYDRAMESMPGVLAFDRPSCTLWTESEPPRPTEGWVLGPAGHRWPEPSSPRLLARLKAVFDPEGEWR